MFPSADLCNLKDGWDGQNAKAPSPREVIEAHKVFVALPGASWAVIPLTTGGIQIEKHSAGVDIEMTIIDQSRE